MITISLTGRLTRDPELRRVARPDGPELDVCEIRVAAHDSRGKVVFLDCVQWGAGGRAAATYLEKGSQVAFTGELRLHELVGAEQTRRRYSAVGRIEFLGGRRANGKVEPDPEPEPAASEPIPF